jgi:hypothetical protein
VHINASSAVCVMLQCFPALKISKFKPIVALKHRCNSIILVLCVTRILFLTNKLIEAKVQPNPNFDLVLYEWAY